MGNLNNMGQHLDTRTYVPQYINDHSTLGSKDNQQGAGLKLIICNSGIRAQYQMVYC